MPYNPYRRTAPTRGPDVHLPNQEPLPPAENAPRPEEEVTGSLAHGTLSIFEYEGKSPDDVLQDFAPPKPEDLFDVRK